MRRLTPALLFVVYLAAGCGWTHDLQPHRLHRLNRNDNMMRSDAYYSVSDPLDVAPKESPNPSQGSR